MSQSVVIGTWVEPEARVFTHCPSYYAADHETLRVKPGEYPVRVTFEGGYLIPMPYWLLIGLDTERVSGALYNGCGGVNYGSTELPAGEAVRHTLQLYAYNLRDPKPEFATLGPGLVSSGKVKLDPRFAWLLEEKPWENPDAPKTWEDVRNLQG
jgi:hypothetical protein